MITWNGAADLSGRRAALFDFDGTLADTKGAIVETAMGVLTDFGLPRDVVAERVGELIGPPFPQAFSQVFGLSESDAAEVTRRYRAIYGGLGAEAWPLFDGVRELLVALRERGWLLAAASSKRLSVLDRGIDDNALRPLLDAVVGKVDSVVDTKAEAIAAALGRLDVRADEAVMVGDRHFDVEGAAACGVVCAGVLWGDTATRAELVHAGAVVVVDTVEELADVLGP